MNTHSLRASPRSERGAVLLEVVLALILFTTAALVIGGGLSASVTAMERNRRNTHAADLAVTVISELKMGVMPVESSGPNPFEPPFEAWTWETVVEDVGVDGEVSEKPKIQKVEVVVRLEEEDFVLRLAEFLPAEEEEELE